MAEEIKMKAADGKFDCGTDTLGLTVFNFTGPGGSKVCAYCCNMNLDLDGEPQAYAPVSRTDLRPLDNLGNAGWLNAAKSAARRVAYEKAKKELSDLEQKKAALIGKANPAPGPGKPAPVPTKAPPDPALALLDTQIAAKHHDLWFYGYEHSNEDHDNYDPKRPTEYLKHKNPKNLGKIFWHWYGVVSLTPEDAARMTYLELGAPTVTVRRPVIDKTSPEDVFGRFPVVQSIFEPGTDYFVTQLPHGKNPMFPRWDQRFFLPPSEISQGAFGALSGGLKAVTGLNLKDKIFAVRLDTTDTLKFEFRDSGNGNKVAECSLGAFTDLGGDYHPERENAAKFPNKFLVLYLAFPGGKAPEAVLAQFATASNADDFPDMLAFVAQATSDAKVNANGSKTVTGDPKAAFDTWKKSASQAKPTHLDVIVQGLSLAGSTFVERMTQKYGSKLMPGTLTR
jgi:hypothetical protein